MSENSESILQSIKKMLGVSGDYFDPEIINFINSQLIRLHQLGVRPESIFTITNETSTWADFLGSEENNLAMVKPFVYVGVKLLFDPPQSSTLLQQLNSQKQEYEWLLNVIVDPPK